jgi:transposase
MGGGYKTGVDRQQLSLLPVCLDDYIPENHICRVISAFTEQIDTAGLGYKYAEYKDTGRRPYDPRMMLNLYMYGYLHRVRSSRRLEAETKRNVEAMWLMNGLKPDDRTICNFRRDNAKALKKTFREFVRMCRELGLYGGEVEATDSTKFRADNSRKNNHNRTTVGRELGEIDRQISEYLAALEQGDKEDKREVTPNAAAVASALKRLRERKEKFEGLKMRINGEGGNETEVSTVDPDARLMHSGGDARPLDVCYNVQTVVDGRHHLIVDFDVAERSDDKGNLHNMTGKAKEALGVEGFISLSDKGYYDGRDIEECEADGIRCLVAKPKPGGAKKAEGFSRKSFAYDREGDCYVCPCKNRMGYMRDAKHSDGKIYRIYANYAACGKCLRKAECTKSGFREVYRSPYQDTLDIVDERTKRNKALYRKRQEIVEHVFGTVKSVWGYKQFLCRTKPKIIAEVSLAYLAYNMRRFITIFTGSGANPAAVLG